MSGAALRALVASGLDGPAIPEARAVAGAVLRRHGGAVAAILFYGSALRERDASGLLDLYVLVDRARDWHPRAPLRAFALRLLPPDVEHWTAGRPDLPQGGSDPGGSDPGDRPLRAKVAVMTLSQFRRRCRPGALDTTVWARFCQPARLLHARDAAARATVLEAVAGAAAAAAHWAVRLGPSGGGSAERWRALFRATYGAELRAERGGDRAALVHAADPRRYDALLAAVPDAGRGPPVDAARAWARRRRWGKALNVLRLVKAAFTFAGGADYLAWKVERHSGVALRLTPWQRRHPVLSAPLLLWRLRRAGAVR